MLRAAREIVGFALTGGSVAILWWGIVDLRQHNYVSAILLALVGTAVLRAGVELVRPSVGE